MLDIEILIKQNLLMRDDDVKHIINVLRRGTITWTGRAEVLRKCRRQVFVRIAKNGNHVYKWEWQCAICKDWADDEKMMEVDHIVELGTFTGDWSDYIPRMYARPVTKHLQALCKVCHAKKTLRWTNARAKYRRKK